MVSLATTGESREVYPPNLLNTPPLELSLAQGFCTPYTLTTLRTPEWLIIGPATNLS